MEPESCFSNLLDVHYDTLIYVRRFNITGHKPIPIPENTELDPTDLET